ncbi:MAG: class I SAM-dependent methyltransferase, partial [Verrucomicrobia bacterium]|nr:class I SAM-dependent methyltransferase [Cytophagales bacterium]
GVGVGRGLEILLESCEHYTGVDKNETLIAGLRHQSPKSEFLVQNIPPLANLPDNTFDWIISFQVIEHIENDDLFVKEIHRVLKPGGKVIITTPNRKLSLTRNPWHIREYLPQALEKLMKKYFPKVDLQGVHGNEKVMSYYEENKKSVAKFKQLDVLKMEYWLPAAILKIPYDFLNRRNRKKLMTDTGELASAINFEDYFLNRDVENCLDFFYIGEK